MRRSRETVSIPQRVLFLLCVFFALAPYASAQEPAGTARFALVIGNSDYQYVDNLPNTANDASDIAEKLLNLGYQVDLHLNSDFAAMTRAIGVWIRRLSAERSREGFFWYAGHGVQVAGENYLLPVDINAEDEAAIVYTSYPLGRLLLSLEQTAKNKLNVVVLDACRDNPFKNLAGGSRGLSRGFVTVEHPPQDIFIMFSTAPGTVAADGEGGRNSPFTEAFLRYIDSSEILPVMAGLVTRETMRLTGGKQRPYQNGSIVSELYYSLASGAPPTPGTLPLNAAAPERTLRDKMVPIPGGVFTMGSPRSEGGVNDEGQRQVRINAFLMGKYEVTQREYRELMGNNPSWFKGDELPVEQVSWFDALEYCNALSLREGLNPAYTIDGEDVRWNREASGYRLPTEAEWEYACRAGTDSTYSTGRVITTDQANFNGLTPYNNNPLGINRERTTGAGSFAPNPWGIYDMHGNVYEWCWDWYGPYPGGEEVETNTAGAETGVSRVVRGGSWRGSAFWVRSAFRDSFGPGKRDSSLGFRVARPAIE